jgi:hypothetical protein
MLTRLVAQGAVSRKSQLFIHPLVGALQFVGRDRRRIDQIEAALAQIEKSLRRVRSCNHTILFRLTHPFF